MWGFCVGRLPPFPRSAADRIRILSWHYTEGGMRCLWVVLIICLTAVWEPTLLWGWKGLSAGGRPNPPSRRPGDTRSQGRGDGLAWGCLGMEGIAALRSHGRMHSAPIASPPSVAGFGLPVTEGLAALMGALGRHSAPVPVPMTPRVADPAEGLRLCFGDGAKMGITSRTMAPAGMCPWKPRPH